MKPNLYVFGDSFTFGHTLADKNKCWANLISKEFSGYNLKNLSWPGGSNWRTCRILHNLKLNENDLVIIGWTISNRFEFGLSEFNDI